MQRRGARSCAPSAPRARARRRGRPATCRRTRRSRSRRRRTRWPSRRGRSTPRRASRRSCARRRFRSAPRRSAATRSRRARRSAGRGPSKGMGRRPEVIEPAVRHGAALVARGRRKARDYARCGTRRLAPDRPRRRSAVQPDAASPNRASASPVTRAIRHSGSRVAPMPLVEADGRRVPVEDRPLEPAAAARPGERRRGPSAAAGRARGRAFPGPTKRSSSHRPRRPRKVEKVVEKQRETGRLPGFAARRAQSAPPPPDARRTAPRRAVPRPRPRGAPASRTRRARPDQAAGDRARRPARRSAPSTRSAGHAHACAVRGSRDRARRRRAPPRSGSRPHDVKPARSKRRIDGALCPNTKASSVRKPSAGACGQRMRRGDAGPHPAAAPPGRRTRPLRRSRGRPGGRRTNAPTASPATAVRDLCDQHPQRRGNRGEFAEPGLPLRDRHRRRYPRWPSGPESTRCRSQRLLANQRVVRGGCVTFGEIATNSDTRIVTIATFDGRQKGRSCKVAPCAGGGSRARSGGIHTFLGVYMKFQRKKVAIALGIGGVALVAGGTAVAQDIRVNVTGTNIKRVDSETAAPIETITREDIQQSGLQTISDVVRQITANNNGTIGDVVHQRLLRRRRRRSRCAAWAPTTPWCSSTAAGWPTSASPTTATRRTST